MIHDCRFFGCISFNTEAKWWVNTDKSITVHQKGYPLPETGRFSVSLLSFPNTRLNSQFEDPLQNDTLPPASFYFNKAPDDCTSYRNILNSNFKINPKAPLKTQTAI